MRDKIVKIFSILIILIMFCGLIAACKDEPLHGGDDGPVVTFPETDIPIISEDGTSEYKIVIPSRASNNELTAASEFKYFFSLSTGLDIEIIRDDEASYSADSKLFLIGNVSFLEDAGISLSYAELGNSGFIIKRKDTNVFICGYGSLGTLYGTYKFLHYNFGFEMYAPDEIAINKVDGQLKLLDIDIAERPDFDYRNNSFGTTYGNIVNSNRLYLNSESQIMYGRWHNSFVYFSKTEFASKLNQWFSPDGTQLCYTARGDNEELSQMQSVLLQKFKNLVRENFDSGNYLEYINFTHEDKNTWCNCDSCLSFAQKYGSAYAAATLIKFLNPIAKELKEWVQEEYPGKEINILIFAYRKNSEAPVKLVNGKFEPIDEDVILEDNIMVMCAPIYADYEIKLTEPTNFSYYNELLKWNAIASKQAVWIYNTNFRDYLTYFDALNSLQDNLKLLKELNVRYLFIQCRHNTQTLTAFDTLMTYLNAKLQWDVDADINKLIQNFFDNYFKDASKPMYELFTMLRAWSAYKRGVLGAKGNCYFDEIADAKYWPLGVLNSFLKQIDLAYKGIEDLKTKDPQLYKELYDRINKESLSYRYLILKNYSSVFNSQELVNMQNAFLDDIKYFGLTRLNELVSIEEFYKTW